MLMVISPAKTLDYETAPATERFTQPQYLAHSQELIEQLRELSPAQISELMHVSDKIGGLNAARFGRSEAHTSELQSLMRTSYAVFRSKKKTGIPQTQNTS